MIKTALLLSSCCRCLQREARTMAHADKIGGQDQAEEHAQTRQTIIRVTCCSSTSSCFFIFILFLLLVQLFLQGIGHPLLVCQRRC